MKSLFALTWAVCLSVCFALVPSVVFAQSTGTFTVTKDFEDGSTASVDIYLSCIGTINVTTTSPQSATEGQPAEFNFDGAELPVDCTATEDVPSGYEWNNTLACYEVLLSSTGPDTATGSCKIINTPVCGDGIQTFAEECDVASSCCDDFTCQFRDPSWECGFSNGQCDESEYCTGSSDTCPADGPNLTTECNASTGACDPAEYCSDASDNCPTDVLADWGDLCRGAAGVCDEAEVCDGTSADCPADVFKDAHTLCRADAGGDGCDVAEVCTGTSVACPTDLFADETTLCGDVPDFECDAQEVCTGTANECGPPPAELAACGVIGKGDGCELNICDSEGPSDFKLLFTPDLPNWVAYKLNASNPGQFFYSLVSEPDVPDNANLLLQIPFPFVTQGNMTLHVFDAADAYTVDSCLVIDEAAGSTPFDVEITMDSYWGEAGPCAEPSSINPPTEPGAYCKHITGPNTYEVKCPADYDPDGGTIPASLALQECWAYVPVEQLGNTGQFAARLHLDYGLKGKFLDTYCPADENLDRYAPGGKGDYGDFDALEIDVNNSSTINYLVNACNIPTCQAYTFAQGVESDQPSDCYSAHEGEGCDNAACEDTVCTADSFCCSESEDWDSLCAAEAGVLCDAGLVVPVRPAESYVDSVNYFKKPVGIFGRAWCNDPATVDPWTPADPLNGQGFAGLEARLFKTYTFGPNAGTPLVKAITDEDGYYFLNYKHKGKAVYYHVELWYLNGTVTTLDDVLLEETSGTGNPGNVPLQANGFAEQNFADLANVDACSSANATDWVAEAYEITKGKFKTISP